MGETTLFGFAVSYHVNLVIQLPDVTIQTVNTWCWLVPYTPFIGLHWPTSVVTPNVMGMQLSTCDHGILLSILFVVEGFTTIFFAAELYDPPDIKR